MADISGNQRRVLGEFIAQLQPHWHAEAGLPSRIERMIRSDRRFGSRDRRLYRELVYTALRYLNWVEPWLGSDFGIEAIAWLAAETPATRAFKEKLLRTPRSRENLKEGVLSAGALAQRPDSTTSSSADPKTMLTTATAIAAATEVARQSQLVLPPGSAPDLRFPAFTAGLSAWPPCPASAQEKAKVLAELAGVSALPSLLPDWAATECPVALEPLEYDALHRRAPLWVRLQGDRPELVLEELSSRHWPWRRSELNPDAIRIDTDADVTDTLAYQSGMLEIQDLGSQLILALAAPTPGGRWLDACAGAGGKSLQLAHLLGPSGLVEVSDVRPEALQELQRRAVRARLGPRIRRARLDSAEASYDGVLVDAPCTGSGTWRRSPHLKAQTTVAQIEAAAALQSRLLAEFSARVKPGGRLVYATCSLCVRENERVVEKFLGAFPHYTADPLVTGRSGRRAGPGLLLTPGSHDGDGFFVASLRRLP